METWTERLRVSLDVFSQLNEIQASLFVNRKLGELGAAVNESTPEFTRFRLASLRIDVRDFHTTSPTLRFEIGDFLQLFDSLTAQCDPPLPQTQAMRLHCTIQLILLRGRRWVDEYNDDSMGVDPSVLFGKYSKHLSPYLGNPFDPTNPVQRDAKEFQRHMDEFLVYREGPLVHEKLVALLGRYPILPFQVKVIRFLNAVEDQLFPTNNPTVTAFASTTP